MKDMTKHILIAALFTTPVWSAGETAEPHPGKPVLNITPFTLESSDGSMKFRMDDAGKFFLGGQHVATAHAEGKLTSAGGELLIELDRKGIVVNRHGKPGANPAEITADGVWKQAGAGVFAWKEGKLDLRDGNHLSINPKDSPSKRAATLFVIGVIMGGPDGSLMTAVQPFGPHTLKFQPAPKKSHQESRGDMILLTADDNKFELRNGQFWFNGRNFGKLDEGSEISLKDGVLTINGKTPAEAEE
jgi:hypothetical protein